MLAQDVIKKFPTKVASQQTQLFHMKFKKKIVAKVTNVLKPRFANI